MQNAAIPIAACLLIVAAGFQHRHQNHREVQNAERIQQAAETLKHAIPLQIGDWSGTDLSIDRRELQVAEIAGCVSRNYAHQVTGEVTQIVLMCGAPGPISVHTPDVCFKGNGYKMVSQPKRITVEPAGGPAAEFWWADFQRSAAGQVTVLRTFWSWRGGDKWRVSDHPRFEFAQSPVLYKLYVAYPLDRSAATSVDTPDTKFLIFLLRELERDQASQTLPSSEDEPRLTEVAPA